MRRTGNVVALPQAESPSAQEIALDELEGVYAFLYRRVGNRQDAEDLTQQVALKAVPRLDPGAPRASIRGYLFTTARTELAAHWSARFGLPEEPLEEDRFAADDFSPDSRESSAVEVVERILGRLPDNYAKVLELRFLRNYSAKEVAREMGTTAGNVRIMQLRALRAAAQAQIDD
ncbi:MAG: RNA polymerase sigma factor [Candidatus Dormibacteraceae bacterium]